MIKRYKIEYNLQGGAGAPLIFTTGLNNIRLSSFTILNQLYNLLNTEQYDYMSKVRNLIYKYNNKISDYNSKYFINVTKNELEVLKFLLNKKLKLRIPYY